MSRNLTAFLLVGSALFLTGITACSPRASLTATPTPLPPTATFTATPTVTLPPTETPTATLTITPVPVSDICSPFTRHPLAELPLLVSWPFNPAEDVHHYGVDLAHWQLGNEESSLYDPVQAILGGTIAGFVIDRPPSGNMIIIETAYTQLSPALIEALGVPPGQSVYHQYAHLADPPDFQIGQPISCGQALDRVGLTGWTVAAHLHVETRWGPPGFTFLSMAYYTGDATPEEMSSYETWFVDGQYQAFDPMLLLAFQQP